MPALPREEILFHHLSTTRPLLASRPQQVAQNGHFARVEKT